MIWGCQVKAKPSHAVPWYQHPLHRHHQHCHTFKRIMYYTHNKNVPWMQFSEETHTFTITTSRVKQEKLVKERNSEKIFLTLKIPFSPKTKKKHIPFTQRYIRNSSNGVENDTSLPRKVLMMIMLKMLKLKRRDKNWMNSWRRMRRRR